ncbi:hypothetical protein [Nostoc sp.]
MTTVGLYLVKILSQDARGLANAARSQYWRCYLEAMDGKIWKSTEEVKG